MYTKSATRYSGFTIIEIMVSMVILSMLMMIFVQSGPNISKHLASKTALYQLHQEFVRVKIYLHAMYTHSASIENIYHSSSTSYIVADIQSANGNPNQQFECKCTLEDDYFMSITCGRPDMSVPLFTNQVRNSFWPVQSLRCNHESIDITFKKSPYRISNNTRPTRVIINFGLYPGIDIVDN